MPDWTAPFHIPRLTDEQYTKAKAARIAKEGYSITFPGLFDIIKIGGPKPMTEEEKFYYRKRMWWSFSRKRLEEIMEMKWKKKTRYEQMLSSPTPEIMQNAGSIMTCIDDAQDAISTLACVGRIAAHFAPRILGKAFLGPIGWLLTANDILNLIMTLSGMGLAPRVRKMKMHGATSCNPFTKKARVRRARKISNWKPGKGDVIQALQTTDQIFGFGISLGPVVGLIQDMITGGARMAFGQPIKINKNPPPFKDWERQALRMLKMQNCMNGVEWSAQDEWDLEILGAGYLAQQVVQDKQQLWNPVEVVENLDDVELIAPLPEDPMTIDIMAEMKTPVEEFCGWPHSGEMWSNVNDIVDSAEECAPRNLRRSIDRSQHSWNGFAMAGLATDTATYALANIEGEEEVEYDYTAGSKVGGEMLEFGIRPAPGMTFDDVNRMTDYFEEIETRKAPTSLKSVSSELKAMGLPLEDVDQPEETP